MYLEARAQAQVYEYVYEYVYIPNIHIYIRTDIYKSTLRMHFFFSFS